MPRINGIRELEYYLNKLENLCRKLENTKHKEDYTTSMMLKSLVKKIEAQIIQTKNHIIKIYKTYE